MLISSEVYTLSWPDSPFSSIGNINKIVFWKYEYNSEGHARPYILPLVEIVYKDDESVAKDISIQYSLFHTIKATVNNTNINNNSNSNTSTTGVYLLIHDNEIEKNEIRNITRRVEILE